MAQEIGVKLALVGHSERRQYFGETDETVRKRTESLLEQGFEVMVCVGETRSEREGGQTEKDLARQLPALFHSAEPPAVRHLGAHAGEAGARPAKLSIAYEPVWAIGTGLTATPDQAQQAHHVIREFVKARAGEAVASKLPILYGGSVTPENAKTLMSQKD